MTTQTAVGELADWQENCDGGELTAAVSVPEVGTGMSALLSAVGDKMSGGPPAALLPPLDRDILVPHMLLTCLTLHARNTDLP